MVNIIYLLHETLQYQRRRYANIYDNGTGQQVNLDNGTAQSSHGYGDVEIEQAWPILSCLFDIEASKTRKSAFHTFEDLPLSLV